MWILIVTVFLGGSMHPAAVMIDHVEGFETYGACMAAGMQWGRSVNNQAPPGTKMSANCVSKSGAPPPPVLR